MHRKDGLIALAEIIDILEFTSERTVQKSAIQFINKLWVENKRTPTHSPHWFMNGVERKTLFLAFSFSFCNPSASLWVRGGGRSTYLNHYIAAKNHTEEELFSLLVDKSSPMKNITSVFAIILSFAFTSVLCVPSSEVAEFTRCNSGRFVNLLYIGNETRMAKDVFLQLSADLEVYSSLGPFQAENAADFNVIMVTKSVDEVALATEESMEMMNNRSVKSFLVVFERFSQENWQTFSQTVSDRNQNALFYLAIINDSNAIDWFFVLTVKNQQQVVINRLTFAKGKYISFSFIMLKACKNCCISWQNQFCGPKLRRKGRYHFL